ncbi:MAG: SDR family oxidoreductase [Alphaproteobacteria bacterium]|nr:SDR family oxidoreductase [Alphaproteobacteria bacterium]
MKSDFLKGKRGLIMGVVNENSIAWGIAKVAAENGAELAFTYQWKRVLPTIEPLAKELGVDIMLPCDVRKEEAIPSVFEALEKEWGELDFVIHSMAFSKKAELDGRYCDTSRKNYMMSMTISAYSFTEVARYARPLMKNGGSLITLSYLGAEKVIPNYNVMGVCKAALEASVRYLAADLGPENIRVNSISAGPIMTLAASGINDFDFLLDWNATNSPLRRTVTQEEIGRTGLYLLSELGSGVTGENLHVDGGYHTVGMLATDLESIRKNKAMLEKVEQTLIERENAAKAIKAA